MSKNEDGLDHIRIPFEKLKFSSKLEVQGYGTIYEGEFDDQKVALKRLNITNLANIKQKLLDEILIISEFRHHPNLVALLGFCDEKSNEIILVYEFVGSGNLAEKMRKRLNTIQRLEICLGAARGLEYLHIGVDSTKHGIVHGNIKPSKILLNLNNSKFEAKVSSFGLSKIVPGSASIKSEEDIEKVTKESDVYDFGVLLLEVLCGVSELVDTDDYQEKHVTELVPKRLEQDKVRKVVHFDIRKEIKTEALETYAKIACQCVMEDVEARPTMGQVVEELEKALRLQGGEVTYVEINGSKKIINAPEEIVVEDGPNDVDNSVMIDSNVDVDKAITEEDVKDLISDDKLDGAGEEKSDEINVIDATSDSTKGEKDTVEDVTLDERSSYVPVLDSVKGESVPDLTETEDAQKESSNNEPETTEGGIDESNTNEKSKVAAENEEATQNKTFTEEAQMDSGNTDLETTEEIIDESNSNEKSNIAAENEDDNQNRTSIEDAQTESSNADLEITKEIIDGSNLNEKSNIVVENEHENQIITNIEDVQKESSNNEADITEDIIYDSNSNEKSIIIDENEDDKQNRTINIEVVQEESSNNEQETTEEIIDDSISNEKSNIILENKDDNQTITHIEDVQKEESTNNEPETTEEIIDNSLAVENEDDNQNGTQAEDGQEETTNNETETTEEIIDVSNLKEKSNIAVENEDDNQNITQTEDAQEEKITIERETTEEIVDDSNSNFADKNEDDNQKVTLIEDAHEENNILQETADDSNSNEKSNIVVEDVDDNQNITQTEDAQEEISNTLMMSSNGLHTTEEINDDLNSNKKSNFTVETEDDNQSMKLNTTSESSNITATTSDHSTNQEVQNTAILETGSRDFNILPNENYERENVEELEHLRIPFEKIKFGKKIDVRGYGSMFEGEFDDQQVALKRLNITNLGNIKPKLLSEIFTISKFRQHPNVVALIGFCDDKNNEIIVVYEYVSSGKLSDKMSKHLTTIQRLEICLGSARGLEYLHTDVDESTPGIVHGDIKLSKILLNSDSNSSKFEAKVSGFGLSKLLPGDVQIARKSTELTKESDVYSFGVLLLEVLCGVPELIDTDDYQERHVTELVPKRLEQNMLRKIVHFDIRNEIKTECLETYAKIACRSVMKESEDRPTMAEVVIELKKALRLQGGEVDDIQIVGSSNGNGLPKETEDEDVQEVEENGEKIGSNIAEEEPELKTESIEETVDDIATIEQSSDIPILGGEDGKNVPEITQVEYAEKENDESTEEFTVDQKSNEEPKIAGENESDQESKIITSLESNNDTKEKGNDGPDNKDYSHGDKITAMEITMVQKVQEPAILDSDNTNAEKQHTLLNTGKKPEMVVNNREGDFNDFATNDNLISVEKTKESESKRSNSTCSKSSNGDSTTPSDYLLPKSPDNGTTVKKTSDGSRNCCSCSWWRYISDRIVFYGGQFWNKIVSCFTWIKGQCSSKND